MGWCSIGIGVWLFVSKDSYAPLTPSSYNAMSAAGLCAAAGITVVIIAFIGCLGVRNQSTALLITYVLFVALLLVVQMSTGAMGFFYRAEVRERVRHELLAHINDSFVSEKNTDPSGLQISWDHLQREMQCCGADSYQDWFRSSHWPRNDFVPDSCCDPALFIDQNDAMLNCGQQHGAQHLWYQQGCYRQFADWLLQHIHIVTVMAAFFVVVELFSVAIAIAVCVDSRRRDQRHRHKLHEYRKTVHA